MSFLLNFYHICLITGPNLWVSDTLQMSRVLSPGSLMVKLQTGLHFSQESVTEAGTIEGLLWCLEGLVQLRKAQSSDLLWVLEPFRRWWSHLGSG